MWLAELALAEGVARAMASDYRAADRFYGLQDRLLDDAYEGLDAGQAAALHARAMHDFHG